MNDMNDHKDLQIEIIKLPYAHYAGAWKVAYADFVTAMMAFFLLMWLLNAVTEEQKNAISDYFNPSHPMVSSSTSGAGGVMGGLTMSPEGAMASQKNPIIPQQPTQDRKRGGEAKSKLQQAKEAAEKARFDKAAEKIKEPIEKSPELAELSKNVLVDITSEGLRIQIIDQEGKPMFASGSAKMLDKMKKLLEQITDIALSMPNDLSIRGHTDATRYGKGAKYTNWELSADRANASRRVILDSGMPPERVNNVMGKAATDPLILDDPLDARNRRITIILLNEPVEAPPVPEDDVDDDGRVNTEGVVSELLDAPADEPEPPVNPYRVTPGRVEFP